MNYGGHDDDLHFEATELRLGLPGNIYSDGHEKRSSSAITCTEVVLRNNKRHSLEGIMTQESSSKSNSNVRGARNGDPDGDQPNPAK